MINVEVSGHQTKADDGDAEPSDGEVNNAENYGSHVEDEISEPHMGMEFGSEDVAKNFYNEYARHMGFSSKVGPYGRSKADGENMYREFVCGGEGLKKSPNESCNAMIRIELKGQNKWVVTKFVKEHSHYMVSSSKAHSRRPSKHFSSVGRTMPETYQGVGLVPSGVMYVSMDGNRVSNQNTRGVKNIHTAAAERSHLVKNSTLMNYSVRPCSQNKTLERDRKSVV